MSSYTPSTGSSLRYRSGSVERSRVPNPRDPAPYRTSYGTERGRPRDIPSPSIRMSRATSYDPFATSNRSNSVIRNTGLSSSDYAPRNTSTSYSNRYGSTEQLSSYRPSSYRSGSSGSSSATSSSSYTPRNVRAGSVSIGAYDPPSSRSSNHTDSLSRYRPLASTTTETSSYTPTLSRYRSTDLSSTSDYSTSKYRSPDNSYSSRCSSTVSSSSNRYSSKVSPYSSRTSTSSSYRSDRDYRSMSRTTDNEEEDEVENTFRKLYRKYVTDSEPDLSKKDKDEESLAEKVARRFESKSEAEDEDLSISEEDEDEILTKYQAKGLRRASSASSITPRASVCNSPSKDVTPKCSPLPTRKEVPNLVESRSVSPEVDAPKSIDIRPLTRSFQMEATFGVTVKKSDSEESEESAESEDDISDKKLISAEPMEPPKTPEEVPVKKFATSIKINGIPMKNEEKLEEKEEKEDKSPVRIRIRTEKSPMRVVEKEEVPSVPPVIENKPIDCLISSAANVLLQHEKCESIEKECEFSKEKSSESDTTTTSSRASTLRKRRDPNRTLENLQSILKAEKMKDSGESSENSEGTPEKLADSEDKKEENGEKKMRRIPIPLVLITEPSNPSTPLATTPVTTAASICLWNKRSSSSTEGDEEEYEDEDEYSSGDWTEGEDDEEYITDEEDDNEYSVSQTFSLKDHMNLTDLYPLATSASNASALVSEFSDGDTFLTNERKEESRGRVDSLFAVPAPTFTCSVTYDGMIPGDEEDEWSDEVHSCEEGDDDDFRVLPIARPGSSSLGAYMSPGSMTSEEDYDGRTVGCTLKLVDRAARKDSGEDSEESEYYEDEEYEDEEYWDEEIEYEDEEEYEYEEEEEELEEYVDEEEEEEEEVDDVTMRSVESSESLEEEEEEEECEELFETPMKLMTESLVEELIEEAIYGELPEETIFALDEMEVEDYTGTKDVQMIPTFVRQMTENVKEESTSRFSDRKPATDFARKAVIQPTKLEKVQVGTKIDTKLAPSEEEKKRKKEEEERKRREEEEKKKKKEKEEKEAAERKKKDEETGREDKSAMRKSALNMKDEDAKKKVATDEKVAAQKARRFGTVSAMAGKFDEKEPEVKKEKENKEGVLYKKSSRLESKDAEKPKRTYEVIKPVINDDFDKQMEEIRQQMKSGSNELQNKMKMLSKGILTATEEAKSKEMEEKRRATNEKATGAFGKAEEEKARWKASRDAEAAREYAKIEAEKHLKKKRILIDKPSGETVLNQEKAEPKRTIRRWKPPPPDPNAVIPSFSCGPKEPVKPKESVKPSSKPSTPTARRKVISPTVTRDTVVTPVPVIGNTKAPTTATVTQPVVAAIQNIPKSDGAAATRIRNNANASPITVASPAGTTVTQEPKGVAKRYSSRRKTQEIVNESAVKPKSKRRKTNPRKKRFIREEKDVDLMLGFQKNSTFEQLERLFDQSSRNRRPFLKFEKIRRLAPSKIFISDLTDIDKIYKSSEIRDIIASVNLIY